MSLSFHQHSIDINQIPIIIATFFQKSRIEYMYTSQSRNLPLPHLKGIVCSVIYQHEGEDFYQDDHGTCIYKQKCFRTKDGQMILDSLHIAASRIPMTQMVFDHESKMVLQQWILCPKGGQINWYFQGTYNWPLPHNFIEKQNNCHISSGFECGGRVRVGIRNLSHFQ